MGWWPPLHILTVHNSTALICFCGSQEGGLVCRMHSIKYGLYSLAHFFFQFCTFYSFSCYGIWVQLKLSPNCYPCFISQSEACREYFQQLSCGLFLKCHVTPKWYAAILTTHGKWGGRWASRRETPVTSSWGQARHGGAWLICRILEMTKAVWTLKKILPFQQQNKCVSSNCSYDKGHWIHFLAVLDINSNPLDNYLLC